VDFDYYQFLYPRGSVQFKEEKEVTLKKVYVEPGCISCGSCEATCPQVFEVRSTSEVKKGVDYNDHKEGIIESAEICPVSVIKYEEE